MTTQTNSQDASGKSKLRTIFLIHHSHTDLGFTHPQPTVRFLQQQFIGQALDLIEATEGYPEDSRCKWTCETTFPVLDWLRNASVRDVERFQAAEKAGSIEVTGCWGVMDQCTPVRAWDFAMRKVEELRTRFGLTIRSAMHSDINGVPWMLPDLLAEHGIERFSMAINEHFGKSSLDRPKPYIWRGPKSSALKVWNGLHYNANQYFGIPYDIAQTKTGIQSLQQWLDARGYDRDFLFFQVTRPDFTDNGGPDPRLPDFVREWNRLGLEPRMKIVTLSGFFDAIENDAFAHAGEVSGEWTDFWNFGTTSTPYETSLNRRVYHILSDVESLCRTLPDSDQIKSAAETSLELAVTYNEHTWGSDKSISAPFNEASRSGLLLKQRLAYEAEGHAKIARGEALRHLASKHASLADGLGILLVNTLPWERQTEVNIPLAWLRVDGCPTISHQHRMQYLPLEFPDLAVPLPQFPIPESFQNAEAVKVEVSVPPEGSLFLQREEIFSRGNPQFLQPTHEGTHLENQHFSVDLDPVTGGLCSWRNKVSGREYIAKNSLSPFGVPVRETPLGGTRADIHPVPDWTKFMGYKGWNKDWQAVRQPMIPDGVAKVYQSGGTQRIRQAFSSEFASGGELEVVLNGDSRSIEVIVRVGYRWDERPCAWYLPMEFDFASPDFDYENCGSIIRLGRDQVPNANMDYQTVHGWARVVEGERGMLVVPRDTPIVSMGGFTFGRMTTPATPRRAMMAAWLHSNYWDTNYAASCLGLVETRFYLTPCEPIDDTECHRFAESVNRPVIIQPVANGPARQNLP